MVCGSARRYQRPVPNAESASYRLVHQRSTAAELPPASSSAPRQAGATGAGSGAMRCGADDGDVQIGDRGIQRRARQW